MTARTARAAPQHTQNAAPSSTESTIFVDALKHVLAACWRVATQTRWNNRMENEPVTGHHRPYYRPYSPIDPRQNHGTEGPGRTVSIR